MNAEALVPFFGPGGQGHYPARAPTGVGRRARRDAGPRDSGRPEEPRPAIGGASADEGGGGPRTALRATMIRQSVPGPLRMFPKIPKLPKSAKRPDARSSSVSSAKPPRY